MASKKASPKSRKSPRRATHESGPPPSSRRTAKARKALGAKRSRRPRGMTEKQAIEVLRGAKPSVSLKRAAARDRLAATFSALGHPARLQILFLLAEGSATHQHLSKATGLKAGPLYHHIRELREIGLLAPRSRDLYLLTKKGERVAQAAIIAQRLLAK